MKLPIVSIIGRPNVGKSSLFNRMIRKRLAVVDEQSGVTRDRNVSLCEWTGIEFFLVDTGGMVPGTEDQMERLILEQASIAMEQADLLMLVVDCQTGITDIDTRIARQILRTRKPVILVANKADNERLELAGSEFYSLGIETVLPVSAANGRGMGDMLDELVGRLPVIKEEESPEDEIRVAIVGRPNVGKSSFVNYLLGENRHIVSDIPGTTRDSIDSPVTVNGRRYVLIDTAGLRKRSRVRENLEYYTTLRTIRAIQRCDVAVVLLDANEGLNFQELKIIEEVSQSYRGMVLAVNKWDIFDKDAHSADIYARQLKEAAPTYGYIPSIFISALKGRRVAKTMALVERVYGEFTRRLPTSELNSFLEEAVGKQPPAAVQGKWIKLYYITQAETAPPTFVVFCNYPKMIQDAYRRYLTNRLRERFGFEGVPLRIKLRSREKK